MADTTATGPAPAIYAHPGKPLSTKPSRDGRSFGGLPPGPCFIPGWLPANRWGYRTAANGKGGKSAAHRLAYRLMVGPIQQGDMVLHRCGNQSCVNPHHLYIGNAQDNADDMRTHGTMAHGDPSGAQLPQTKLTPGDVEAIRSAPGSLRQIAQRFGVSFGYVSRIRNGFARTTLGREVQS